MRMKTMKKQRIFGFFDEILKTPVFLFLCAIFLCGAFAGGLTGLAASEGDGAIYLANVISDLPAHAGRSILCAILWIVLPLICAMIRPATLFLSALTAARGFIIALTIAVSIGQGNFLLSLFVTGIPGVFSISALLAACTIIWQSCEISGKVDLGNHRGRYIICMLLALLSAFLRIGFVILWNI